MKIQKIYALAAALAISFSAYAPPADPEMLQGVVQGVQEYYDIGKEEAARMVMTASRQKPEELSAEENRQIQEAIANSLADLWDPAEMQRAIDASLRDQEDELRRFDEETERAKALSLGEWHARQQNTSR